MVRGIFYGTSAGYGYATSAVSGCEVVEDSFDGLGIFDGALLDELLPLLRYDLLEVDLGTRVRPLVLPWVRFVSFEPWSPMHSPCAAPRFPALATARPMRSPQHRGLVLHGLSDGESGVSEVPTAYGRY